MTATTAAKRSARGSDRMVDIGLAAADSTTERYAKLLAGISKLTPTMVKAYLDTIIVGSRLLDPVQLEARLNERLARAEALVAARSSGRGLPPPSQAVVDLHDIGADIAEPRDP